MRAIAERSHTEIPHKFCVGWPSHNDFNCDGNFRLTSGNLPSEHPGNIYSQRQLIVTGFCGLHDAEHSTNLRDMTMPGVASAIPIAIRQIRRSSLTRLSGLRVMNCFRHRTSAAALMRVTVAFIAGAHAFGTMPICEPAVALIDLSRVQSEPTAISLAGCGRRGRGLPKSTWCDYLD